MRVLHCPVHSYFGGSSDAAVPSRTTKFPLAMISPVASRPVCFQSLSRRPLTVGLQNNAVNYPIRRFNVEQGDLKIDFKATQKDNISYRFTRAYQNNPSNNSQELLSNGYSTTPIYNTVGDWSRTIGNNLVNDARFGWSHVTLNSGNSLGLQRRAVR